MGLKLEKFAEVLKGFSAIGLDSAVLIYHLEDLQPYSLLTQEIFTAVARGIRAVSSTISITELLVKPLAAGAAERVEILEGFFKTIPNLNLIPPGYEIARRAAGLRARHRLRTPDAIHAATALVEGASAIITNDADWRRIAPEGIRVVVLDDYIK